MRQIYLPLFLTVLISGSAQAQNACAGVYQYKSIETLFEMVGSISILPESQMPDFISTALIADTVPAKPFFPGHEIKSELSEDLLAFEGLPWVQAPPDARMIPVISKMVQSPYHATLEKLSLPVNPPSLESRGQFLLQLGDGSWVGAKPLLSSLIFDHGIIYQNFRFGSGLDEAPELAKGVRLATELGETSLGPKIHGIWFDSNGTPFMIHALTHQPQHQLRNEGKWNLADLNKLESVLNTMQTSLKAETLDVFAIERRDVTDDGLKQSLKHLNQESPLRFEKEINGRIQVSGFKYSNWYFQKFGMDAWLKNLGSDDHAPPTGIETPFNSRNGLFTLIRLENILKAPTADALSYLQALRSTNLQAWTSVVRLINELKDVERLKPLQTALGPL